MISLTRADVRRALELVIFIVGAGNKVEGRAGVGVEIREFRKRLVFFNYAFEGLLARTPIGEPVHLPLIKERTMQDFLAALTSPEGQAVSFQKLDNLCTAYAVAKALFDDKLQQMVIERIRDRVVAVAKTDKRDELYEKLVAKAQWAWSEQSEGRIGLRRVLTSSLAFLCTGYEVKIGTKIKDEGVSGKKLKKPVTEIEAQQGPPVLRLAVCAELEDKLGRYEWFSVEFMPDFMKKCVALVNHNKNKKTWEMLQVARLYPAPEVVNLAE